MIHSNQPSRSSARFSVLTALACCVLALLIAAIATTTGTGTGTGTVTSPAASTQAVVSTAASNDAAASSATQQDPAVDEPSVVEDVSTPVVEQATAVVASVTDEVPAAEDVPAPAADEVLAEEVPAPVADEPSAVEQGSAVPAPVAEDVAAVEDVPAPVAEADRTVDEAATADAREVDDFGQLAEIEAQGLRDFEGLGHTIVPEVFAGFAEVDDSGIAPTEILQPVADNDLALDLYTRGHLAYLEVTYDFGALVRGGNVIIDYGDGETLELARQDVGLGQAYLDENPPVLVDQNDPNPPPPPRAINELQLSHTYEPTLNPIQRQVRITTTDADGAVVAFVSQRFTTQAVYALTFSPLTVHSPSDCDAIGKGDFRVLWDQGYGTQNRRFDLGKGESHTMVGFVSTTHNITVDTEWKSILAIDVDELDFGYVFDGTIGPFGPVALEVGDHSLVLTGGVDSTYDCDAYWTFEASLDMFEG